MRSWKRSLLIAFPAAVVYFCRSVFLIHVYSCAAVNLQANRTHAVTTDSFPLTSHALENGMAQPNGITQYSHRSYCNLNLSGRHQRKKKDLPLTFFMWHIFAKYQLVWNVTSSGVPVKETNVKFISEKEGTVGSGYLLSRAFGSVRKAVQIFLSQ